MSGAALKTPPDLSFDLRADGPKAMLLIHGMTGAPGEMRLLARRLHRRGLSVATPLLAGHGIDEDELLKTRWQDWLGTVRDAFHDLKARYDEVHVAGICVGGALGLALCAEETAVASAAVYSMTYRYDGWNMPPWNRAITPFVLPFTGLPLLRRMMFTEPYPYGLKDERLREGMNSSQASVIPGLLDHVPLGSMGQMHALSAHIDKVASRISQRVLILHASDDDMSHPRNARRLKKSLGARAQLHMLDDCYHMIHVDRQRDLVADLTADFVGAALRRPVHSDEMLDA